MQTGLQKRSDSSENQEVQLPMLHLAWDRDDQVQILLQFSKHAVNGQQTEPVQQQFYLFLLSEYYYFPVTLHFILNLSTKQIL